MTLFQIYHFLLLVILLSLTTTSVAGPIYSKAGCKDTCGNVRIPFPFGMGEKCFVNKWYAVECNSSKPYLSALNHLEVVSVDLENQTVTINMPAISKYSQTKSVDLGSTPFLYSRSHNKFIVQGCGHAVMMDDHGSVLTGCSNTCSNDTTTVTDRNKCFGISCCEATIPHYLKSYNMNLTGLESLGGDGPCGFAHLVDKNYSYVEASSFNYVKTSLLWTLSDHDFDQISCQRTGLQFRVLVDLGSGTSISPWKCSASSVGRWLGNPYLIDGMDVTEECARCKGNGNNCYYDDMYIVDGLVSTWNFTCVKTSVWHPEPSPQILETKSSLGIILEMDLFTVVQLTKPVAVKTGVRPLRDDEEPILAATEGRVMELTAGDTGTSSSVAVEATPLQSRPTPEVTSLVAQSAPIAGAHPGEEEEEEVALSRKRTRRDHGAGPSRKKRPVTQTVELSSTDEASSQPSADDAEPKMEQVIESPPKASPTQSAHSEPSSQENENQADADVPLDQLVEELVQVSAQQAALIVKLKDRVSGGEDQSAQKDQTITLLEAQLASTQAQLDSARAEARDLNAHAQKQAEDKMALMCQISQDRAEAARYQSACRWALKHLEQGKESCFTQLEELGATVSWSLEVQEAKLRKMSIEYDEELYPHLMSTIAERRWLISHGLRLAALSTLESPEVVGAFGEVVQCALERGKSEAMEKLHEAKLLEAALDEVPGYDAESYAHLVAAMQKMKDLELPMISELERDQDYPINVIMTGLTLARHRTEDVEAQPDFYLKPHGSQLQVPVFARPRDSQNPFALEKEVSLKEVLEAHATRLAKKKGIAGKAILCGVGAAHLPRSDGVPVSVATVSRQDADVLKNISEAKDATGDVGTSTLKRCNSW